MIALRLLGPADLRGTDGSVLRRVLAKPKRLALLAYLAAGRPSGFHSRDALLTLLWPEFDQDHARAALRQALYVLRGALGDDVVIGCGDSVLGVDAERIWCDTNAFDHAAGAQEHIRALEFYRGDFLAGFHISDAPEFERWVGAERARLAAMAAAAATTLAEQAEARGDVARALDWAQRLLALCPDDERALRRVVSLLQRLGDRGSAIRLYRHFADRMKAEYDLQPSAESRALISGLRGEA